MPVDAKSAARNRRKCAGRLALLLLLLAGFASAAGAQVVTAAWNANPEPDVNAYLLSYGTSVGSHPTTITTGAVTIQQVTLTPGFIYYFVVQARNTAMLVSPPSTEMSIDLTGVNQAPTLTQPLNQTSAENEAISLPLVANDPDGAALTYSATGLPPSLSVTATTGMIGGTLTFTSAGTYTVTATVSDGSLANSKTFSWTVTDVPQAAPTITSRAPTSGPVGAAVTITGTNFGASKGTSSVTFNGTIGMPTTWTGTSILVPVPSGATSGNIVVTVGGAASNGVGFTVPPLSVITMVQHRSKDASTTASASLAFNTNNSAGNFIAVVVRIGGIGQALTVTDTRGNLYRLAVRFNGGTDNTGAIYYAENVGGGANTVAVSVAAATTVRLAILEYAGVAASNSLDGAVMAQGTSKLPSSGSLTTTVDGELLLGAITSPEQVNVVAGAGYVIQESISGLPFAKVIAEDRRLASAGTASATATLSVAYTWGAALAAFKPAPSGSGSATITSLTSKSDGAAVAVTRPVLKSSTGTGLTASLGMAGDKPVSGDYDGDGKADIAVYRPATGEWTALLSSSNYVTRLTVTLGGDADIPAPGDYDGDAVTDIAVYQPATGQWQILKSSTHYATSFVTLWGARGDIPVPGDYDGDGRADLAVYRPRTAEWRILLSTTDYATPVTIVWGAGGDFAVPADYDGDGRIDLATYRPSTGTWYILQSSTNFGTSVAIPWGGTGGVPMAGDYDGDGRADLGVFQSGVWQILLSGLDYSTSVKISSGTSGDVPLPSRP